MTEAGRLFQYFTTLTENADHSFGSKLCPRVTANGKGTDDAFLGIVMFTHIPINYNLSTISNAVKALVRPCRLPAAENNEPRSGN